MTAEEFYNKGIEWLDKSNEGSRKQELIDFAEAYHKAEVEAISDEDVNNEFSRGTSIEAIQWFKEQLLKQQI